MLLQPASQLAIWQNVKYEMKSLATQANVQRAEQTCTFNYTSQLAITKSVVNFVLAIYCDQLPYVVDYSYNCN